MQIFTFEFWLRFQFIRFILVGLFNTLVDLAVYNLVILTVSLSPLTLLTAVGKASGFSVAVTVSFFLNRGWTFKKAEHEEHHQNFFVQYWRFILISLIGLLLNMCLVFVSVLYLNTKTALSDFIVANLAYVMATAVTMFWSFFAYKFLVFRKKTQVQIRSEVEDGF